MQHCQFDFKIIILQQWSNKKKSSLIVNYIFNNFQ